ncbi:redoxin domain-containing protein [Chitinophaga sp. YIM B06452]|uniref:redoxin domain-containing protein n=1 Tax=Chitinophaga sp. YIM B06452 TaxID=3082158 RepID=UPI0031FF0E47
MRTINRYADFLPLSYDIRRTKPQDNTPIKPISAGHTLPLFNLHKEDFVVPFQFLNRESSYIVGSELLNQPLVLAFFSIHWNGYGEKYIKELQDLYADIQVMGGQLLVVSADSRKELEEVVARYSITFPLAQDRGHQIARSAGIYAETDPLWDRLSGFEENAPLPAIYVIGQSQRITYDFTDRYFDRVINRRELLSEVYTAGQAQALSRAIA